jgi:hypothetical protein
VALITFAIGEAFKNSKPELHMEQLTFLGAALLGASFSGLYRSYEYVQKRIFDPASGSSYMVRVVLGTVSGLILANIGYLLIGRITGTSSGDAASATTGAAANNALTIIGPGTLALIGGYSADAVNLILQRIADTLVTTVRGSADDSIKAKQAQLEVESKTASFEQRQATVSALTELLKNATDDATKNSIQQLMSAVGQGNVTGDLLKPAQANGKGVLDLTGTDPIHSGGTPKVNPTIAAAESTGTSSSTGADPVTAPPPAP